MESFKQSEGLKKTYSKKKPLKNSGKKDIFDEALVKTTAQARDPVKLKGGNFLVLQKDAFPKDNYKPDTTKGEKFKLDKLRKGLQEISNTCNIPRRGHHQMNQMRIRSDPIDGVGITCVGTTNPGILSRSRNIKVPCMTHHRISESEANVEMSQRIDSDDTESWTTEGTETESFQEEEQTSGDGKSQGLMETDESSEKLSRKGNFQGLMEEEGFSDRDEQITDATEAMTMESSFTVSVTGLGMSDLVSFGSGTQTGCTDEFSMLTTKTTGQSLTSATEGKTKESDYTWEYVTVHTDDQDNYEAIEAPRREPEFHGDNLVLSSPELVEDYIERERPSSRTKIRPPLYKDSDLLHSSLEESLDGELGDGIHVIEAGKTAVKGSSLLQKLQENLILETQYLNERTPNFRPVPAENGAPKKRAEHAVAVRSGRLQPLSSTLVFLEDEPMLDTHLVQLTFVPDNLSHISKCSGEISVVGKDVITPDLSFLAGASTREEDTPDRPPIDGLVPPSQATPDVSPIDGVEGLIPPSQATPDVSPIDGVEGLIPPSQATPEVSPIDGVESLIPPSQATPEVSPIDGVEGLIPPSQATPDVSPIDGVEGLIPPSQATPEVSPIDGVESLIPPSQATPEVSPIDGVEGLIPPSQATPEVSPIDGVESLIPPSQATPEVSPILTSMEDSNINIAKQKEKRKICSTSTPIKHSGDEANCFKVDVSSVRADNSSCELVFNESRTVNSAEIHVDTYSDLSNSQATHSAEIHVDTYSDLSNSQATHSAEIHVDTYSDLSNSQANHSAGGGHLPQLEQNRNVHPSVPDINKNISHDMVLSSFIKPPGVSDDFQAISTKSTKEILPIELNSLQRSVNIEQQIEDGPIWTRLRKISTGTSRKGTKSRKRSLPAENHRGRDEGDKTKSVNNTGFAAECESAVDSLGICDRKEKSDEKSGGINSICCEKQTKLAENVSDIENSKQSKKSEEKISTAKKSPRVLSACNAKCATPKKLPIKGLYSSRNEGETPSELLSYNIVKSTGRSNFSKSKIKSEKISKGKATPTRDLRNNIRQTPHANSSLKDKSTASRNLTPRENLFSKSKGKVWRTGGRKDVGSHVKDASGRSELSLSVMSCNISQLSTIHSVRTGRRVSFSSETLISSDGSMEERQIPKWNAQSLKDSSPFGIEECCIATLPEGLPSTKPGSKLKLIRTKGFKKKSYEEILVTTPTDILELM